MASARHPYQGERAALLTQHAKERVIAPAWRETFEAEVLVVRDFDTDLLGTFTREVSRQGTQLDAARRKAELACERSGLPLGLGSEGSFSPGPFGLGSWNRELVVFLDAARGLEVVGQACEPGLHCHGLVSSLEELVAFARDAGFPEHGLVLRPDDERGAQARKGLRSWAELEAAFCSVLPSAQTGRVFVENDLRAHQHPSRMAVIQLAMRDLLTRLVCLCPSCSRPGFGHVAAVTGLPCQECGMPTEVPRADEYGCQACGQRERRPREGARFADPSRCEQCNP
jgi:hypothetical protein